MPSIEFPIPALNREIFTEINLGELLIVFAALIAIVSVINRYSRSKMLDGGRR